MRVPEKSISTIRVFTIFLLLAVSASASLAPQQKQSALGEGWIAYGGDPGGSRYSSASQISRENVAQLKVAWTFHTGASQLQTNLIRKAAFESTPILFDNKLFLTSPYDKVFALDPATGERIWEFDPHVDLTRNYSEVTSRGVSAWRDAKAKPGEPCALRIFLGTLDARLIALDAETGRPCSDFAAAGTFDLSADASTTPEWRGGYQVTSAPAVANDLVITGSSIADNWKVDVGRGIVRAFDARAGKLRWSWDPIPWASKSNPHTGAGNAWSTLSVDSEHDLVFIPTGSASQDYFGVLRLGDNKWANSVVALRASTGEFVWGYQVVHHDLWDYDTASPPLLTTLDTKGKEIPVVIQGNKTGFLYILNRETGVPE